MYILKTSPESEPLTLSEVKTHLKEDLSDTDNDNYISSLITAARKFLEEYTSFQCLEATWELYLDEWPSGDVLFLKKKPVTEVVSVEYYASDDAAEYSDLNAADYEVDIYGEPARIKVDDAPNLGDKLNAVKVTFKAGYSSADNVPGHVKQAMLMLIGSLYENRQDEVTGTQVNQLERNFEWLCSMFELKSA